MKKRINEFEAAVLVKMSPKLLKWLTKNAPKYNEQKKLNYTETKDNITYFKLSDVEEFDRYLSKSWPIPPNSARPNIPKGIKREIERESGGACAICGVDDCEFAHIDAVSNSQNNHPHNLIYLCPNCHTKYDKKKYSLREMRMIKNDILEIQVIKWTSYSKLFNSLISLTSALDSLQGSKDKIDAAIYENLESQVLKKIKKSVKDDFDENDTNDVRYRNSEKYAEYRNKVKDIMKSKNAVKEIINCRDEYLKDSSEERCPLCHGKGIHNNWECPICRGIGTIDKNSVDAIDLSGYLQVKCPLCKGKGIHNNWECHICRGVGTIDKDNVDEIDLSGYLQVKCPLCKGKGIHNNWECHICRGVGTIDKNDVDEIDLSGFQQVSCPLCEEKRVHNELECPICRGVGTIDKDNVDVIDLSGYQQVKCPLCKGKRVHNEQECPICRGVGTVNKDDVAEIDLSGYKQVSCPLCKGKRVYNEWECPICRGLGTVNKIDYAEIDLSEY